MPRLLVRAMLPMLLALAGGAAESQAPAVRAPTVTRGQILYDTHCIACHNTQVHWRDKKLVVDWASLKGEVRRWQATAGQWWSEADIVEVTRYLNDTIYRYPPTSDAVGRLAPVVR